MSVAIAQPIAGVSANRETEIEVIYPSVAAGVLGRFIGGVMGLAEAVPLLPLRLIAYIVLGTAMVPFAILAYALTKLLGNCYVLTNRSIYSRSIIGGRKGRQVPLGEIGDIEITSAGGYHFHRVGDLNLQNSAGNLLMTIPAITYPDRLKQIILDAQAARMLSDESFARIQSRK
ncbi:hypothetical protein SH661x_000776 [Planctomicrobium sp. SH661]|uniref:hypothetical protein n=1 Tax=Planctomicrobium sp. SH661 TaxID=3448124 RepID=UPI003F5C1162